MIRRSLLLVCAFLLSVQSVSAQIADEVKSFVDSTEIIVNNGRKMIVSRILEDNYTKANEIYRYLTEVTTQKPYSAFHFTEDIYLNLLFCDWNNLKEHLMDYKGRINRKIYQDTYYILPQLQEKVVTITDSISSECQKSELDQESKRMIDLILFLMKNGSNDWGYNTKLEAFHKDFENTVYSDLLDNYLPKKRAKAALSWSMGSGMVFTTGNLNRNFSPNASINLSMDININRIFTSLYLNSSGLRLQQPFEVSDGVETLSFMDNESFHYLDAGLKAGWFILRNRNLHFSPFASVSGSSLKSKRFDAEDDEKEYKVFNSFTSGAGLHTEIKFTEFKTTNIYSGYTKSYVSLKLEGGYNFITKFNDDLFKGNTAFITVALVWGIGDF